MPAVFQFVGILIIIWIALFYEADGAVRRMVTPFVKASSPVMRLISPHRRHHPVADRPAVGLALKHALVVAACVGLAGCGLVTRAGVALLYEKAELHASQIVQDVCYAYLTCSTADQTLDFYLPTQRDWPVMVFVHGGNWDSGDKNYRAGGADVYANIGRYYATRGIGVAVINYRLQPRVEWSAQVDDAPRSRGCAATSLRGADGRIARS